MRTNIVLDEELIEEARRLTGTRTKQAIVEEALVTLIRVKPEEARSQRYRERLARIRQKLDELDPREFGSHELLREDRDSR